MPTDVKQYFFLPALFVKFPLSWLMEYLSCSFKVEAVQLDFKMASCSDVSAETSSDDSFVAGLELAGAQLTTVLADLCCSAKLTITPQGNLNKRILFFGSCVSAAIIYGLGELRTSFTVEEKPF